MLQVWGVHLHIAVTRRRWVPFAAAILLAACGGTDGEAPFDLTITDDFSTTLEQAALSGSVSLPAGSERAGGTTTMPIVTCQLGPYSMSWSNSTNGTRGTPSAMWDCPKDRAAWSAQKVPLAMGANVVTVTMSDSSRTAQASVVITRQ
jgi:hypothetical protein